MKRSLITQKEAKTEREKHARDEKSQMSEQTTLFHAMSAGAVCGAACGGLLSIGDEDELPFAKTAIGAISGVGLSAAYYFAQDVRMSKGAKKRLADVLDEIEVNLKRDMSSLDESAANIFASYLDSFVVESIVYDTVFEAESAETELENAKKLFEETEQQIQKVKDSILREKKLNEGKRRDLNPKKAEKLQKHEEELEKLDIEIKQLKHRIETKDQTVEKLYEFYLISLANREARERFFKTFNERVAKILYEIDIDKRWLGEKRKVRGFYARQLERELREMILAVETDYEHFVKDFEAALKIKTSTVGRMSFANAGATSFEMTYGNAPYYKLMPIAVSPSSVKLKEVNEFDEIRKGAQEDFAQGRDKGAWLVKRNYSDTWLFTVSDFSEAEAEELSLLLTAHLSEKISIKTDYKTVHKAYVAYAKRHHSDVSEEDENMARVNYLMERYKKYAMAYKEIFGEENE